MAVSRRARTARVFERALSGLGVLALGYWAWEVAGTRLHQRAQERRLESLKAQAEAPGPGGATRAVERTALVGRMEVPRLGLVAMVEEGVDQRTLRRAAGHLPGSALPGEAGNVVVAAHRDTFFRSLEHVRPGDALRFVTPGGEFRYVVVGIDVVEPSRTDVLAPGRGHEATLITCYPFAYVGPAPRRFVVRAVLVEPRARLASARPPAPRQRRLRANGRCRRSREATRAAGR
jgi:sortase A